MFTCKWGSNIEPKLVHEPNEFWEQSSEGDNTNINCDLATLLSQGSQGKTPKIVKIVKIVKKSKLRKDDKNTGVYTLVDVFESKHCNLPAHMSINGVHVEAVQWDSVIMMKDALGMGYTFLVAGSTTDSDIISQRIEQTKSFISVCNDVLAAKDGISNRIRTMCYIWDMYKENEIRCVIGGAPALPADARALMTLAKRTRAKV